MTAQHQGIDPTILSDLVPVKALSPDHLQELAQKSHLKEFPQGKFLFKKGDEAKRIIYIVKGEAELITEGDRRSVMGGTKVSKLPLEQNKIHQFSAMAKTDVTAVLVDPNLLDIMLTWEQSGGYEVQDLGGGGEDQSEDDDWMSRILQANVFHRIPPANIQSIFMKMEANHFKAGEAVIKQGEDGDRFYIIREGACKVIRKTRKNPDGVVLASLSVGDNFGEEALISGGKRNASVVMVKSGVLMSLSKNDFLELMNEPLLNWVNINEARDIANGEGVWVDVRLPTEYQTRHLEGSINIPLPILRSKVDKLDRDRKYILYCDTGRRSSTATYLMTQNGFVAYVLKDGLQNVDPDDLISSQ